MTKKNSLGSRKGRLLQDWLETNWAWILEAKPTYDQAADKASLGLGFKVTRGNIPTALEGLDATWPPSEARRATITRKKAEREAAKAAAAAAPASAPARDDSLRPTPVDRALAMQIGDLFDMLAKLSNGLGEPINGDPIPAIVKLLIRGESLPTQSRLKRDDEPPAGPLFGKGGGR